MDLSLYLTLFPERNRLYILGFLESLSSLFSPLAGEGYTCLDHSKLSKKKNFHFPQKKKETDETLAVSIGVEPPWGRCSKKKKIKIDWGSGIKKRTMMAMRHADDRSQLLEVQWGFAYIGTLMSLGTTPHGVRCQLPQRLESTSLCTFILPVTLMLHCEVLVPRWNTCCV